jgi:ribulose bisphosphate carboxylase small subunit
MNQSINKKSWEEFQNTGLLLFINQLLHIFGWAICLEYEDDGTFISCYPARVNFRGFEQEQTDKAYAKVTNWMQDHALELAHEINNEDAKNYNIIGDLY